MQTVIFFRTQYIDRVLYHKSVFCKSVLYTECLSEQFRSYISCILRQLSAGGAEDPDPTEDRVNHQRDVNCQDDQLR